MVMLVGWVFLMSEVPMYAGPEGRQSQKSTPIRVHINFGRNTVSPRDSAIELTFDRVKWTAVERIRHR